ncbi:Murein DD-endopeptidase MepM [Fundidesulfovibrio magnetotacticus]|uniref:Murein DD-endopeptidase MepM n=2 Tax=Fundidesulfovibrio magnetotacticus TaxID=2730080 RepID=A0A6V8LNY5_9BACT|nr:Murein DD-endopeptidase MepM [Fundidesulfovibrio magnetotacticus]
MAHGAGGQAPEKAFGKILDSLTPEKAQAAGMDPQAVNTLARQAQNKAMTQAGDTEAKKLREACEGFESVFITQLLKEMRKTVPKDGLLHSSYEDQYVSMFDEEFSKSMAKKGGLGLADFMESQLAARSGKQQSRTEGMAGLRSTAFATTPTGPQARTTDPRGQGALNPLRTQGLRQGQEVVQAAPNAAPNAGSRPGSSRPLPGPPLSGTPSQHLGLPGAQYLPAQDAALASGAMVQPVEGELTSNFGWRRDPFTGQRAWHGGIDIAAPEGTPVVAAREGTVVFSGRKGGYGNLVVLEHAGGMRTFYGHNRSNAVAEGQAVKAGQLLAEVGQTGRATGPHLHFEVRVGEEAVDPAKAGGPMLAAAPDPRLAVPRL